MSISNSNLSWLDIILNDFILTLFNSRGSPNLSLKAWRRYIHMFEVHLEVSPISVSKAGKEKKQTETDKHVCLGQTN